MIMVTVQDIDLEFEHSLVSLSDWEAEYEKPFYPAQETEKTEEELRRYFEYMLIGKSRKYRYMIQFLTLDQMLVLGKYISDPKTATTVREVKEQRGVRENITSELIYYWLVSFKIPFTPTDTWHLNRLLMLVKVCGAKQSAQHKPTKQNKTQQAMSMRQANEARRKQLGTRG